MMMQELPLGQMNLSGPGELPPGHLDRLGNMKVEVGEVEAKPVWSDEDTKPPWARSVSPGGHHQMRAWVQAGHPGPRPEDYEGEDRAKAALENGVNGERGVHYLEPPGHGEEDHYPGYPPPHGSPSYHDGPGTPHDHHALHSSFSPEQLAHHQNLENGPPGSNTAASKKSSSRRNAWGNLSYADLITQAILSSPEKRLTLSQVYDWMVQNIAYFKDKGDSNSSAGWKNSIRHNLSLHNKFIRVQNEGTGKSSWWMINAEAKSGGKSSRRRSSNPDNGKGGYDSKRRGRSKKSLDILRGGQESTPSPSGMPEGFPDSPLHPGFAHGMHGMDMRLRAGSNEFGRPCSPGGRIPHPGAEFFGGGEGWPGHPEQYGPMVQYGPPGAFRPPGYPEEMDPEMMARMGIDPRNMPPHLRPAYPFPHGAVPPDHPHYQTLTTMSPAHGPSLSPIPQHISPDHQQPPTPASAHEPLMSPHHLNQTGGVFFPGSGAHHGSCALSAPQPSGPPDSPAAGSSSSSDSILERALAKQEPPSPSSHHEQQHHDSHQHQHHHMHHQGHPDWPHIAAQGFGDVNVEEYIKHDFTMDMNEFPGYQGGHPAQAQEGQEGGHHQYPHPGAPVSVGPPWVR